MLDLPAVGPKFTYAARMSHGASLPPAAAAVDRRDIQTDEHSTVLCHLPHTAQTA